MFEYGLFIILFVLICALFYFEYTNNKRHQKGLEIIDNGFKEAIKFIDSNKKYEEEE